MHLRFKRRTSTDLPWVNASLLVLLGGLVAPVIALWLRDPGLLGEPSRNSSLIYIGVGAVFTTFSFLWFGVSHGISRFFSVADGFTIFKAAAVAVLCTVFICFFVSRLDDIPRSVPLIHFVVLVAGLVGFRSESHLRRRRRERVRALGGARENVLIVGVSELSFLYTQIVEQFAFDSVNVVGFLDERLSLQGRFVHGYPVSGRVRDIELVLNEYEIHGVKIDRLVVADLPEDIQREMGPVLSSLAQHKALTVEQLPERLGIRIARPPASEGDGGEPVLQDLEIAGVFWRSKRLFDVTVSLAFLLVAAPVAVLVSIFVLIDCGAPVLFWQVRIGRYGQRITVYKFRTLRSPYDAKGTPIPNERRVSFVGKFLRFTHLDEMPQVISILAGDMSFIGPRPLLPIDLSDDAWLRFAVRPGITGWAQVNGATRLSIEEKNAMDEWYVRHASLMLEVKIMVRTILMLFVPARRNEAAIRKALAERRELSPGA